MWKFQQKKLSAKAIYGDLQTTKIWVYKDKPKTDSDNDSDDSESDDLEPDDLESDDDFLATQEVGKTQAWVNLILPKIKGPTELQTPTV